MDTSVNRPAITHIYANTGYRLKDVSFTIADKDRLRRTLKEIRTVDVLDDDDDDNIYCYQI